MCTNSTTVRAAGSALLSVVILCALTTLAFTQDQSPPLATEITGCTVIDKPGSYYLSRNITATQNSLKSRSGTYPSCILILADFVTFDLEGHTISGPGLGPSGFAVYSSDDLSPSHKGTHIRNGIVTKFERGIALEGEGHRVERVRAQGNGDGFSFEGNFFSLEDVYAVGNVDGVFCLGGEGHSIRRSHFISNLNSGIDVSRCPGNSIVGNTLNANSNDIVTGCPSLVLQNVSYRNGSSDISTVGSAACTPSDNAPLP